ncbi:hypothetical protein GCM10027598_58870 [Amycolatopsis oliviviridis]|uniref:ATP-binding protein n=1 Tax=Amycolatopsis oliviviridis TaxID=1471590 RepID=UPI001E5B1E5A|nr:LuxR family transcriptional regulator [Amycolatopsis oliviviridis]
MDPIIDTIRSAGPPLVLLTGLAGVGRTTTLALLGERYEAEGRHVSAMRFTPRGDVVPARFTPTATRLRGPVKGEPVWAAIGPVARAADEPGVAQQAARAAAMALRRTGEGVVLLDDLQWIDRDSLAVLEALIRLLDGRPVTFVGTLRVPAGGAAARYGPDTLSRLRAENLVHTVRLKPWDKRFLAERLADTLSVVPEPALVDHVHALSGGVHAAVDEVMENLRGLGAIRVLDRSAYLVPAATEGRLWQSEFGKRVRELGREVWDAAKAAAILHPLGAAMPGLVGQSLGTSEEHALELLEELRRAGILHRGRGGASWRFTMPLAALALADSCGPCERRELAAAGVEALWAGTAACADPDRRADLVADAGRLVDPARAAGELLTRAAETGDEDPGSAMRWIATATDLIDDRTRRAESLRLLTVVSHGHGDHERTLDGARILLGEFLNRLSADSLVEVQSLLVHALSGLGRTGDLREIADGTRRLPGSPGSRLVIRALACGMLDRWPEAEVHLTNVAPPKEEGKRQAVLARLIGISAPLWQGKPEAFDRSLRDRKNWPAREVGRYREELVDAHLTGLLLTGELGRAEDLLVAEGLVWEETRPCVRTLAATLRGDFRSATALVSRIVAERSAPGFAAATAGMYHATVSALVSQGRLATARALSTAAEATRPVLAHLLDFTEAQIDRALGDDRGAADRYTAALAAAAERGLVIGTDIANAELAELAWVLGDLDTAKECLKTAQWLAAARYSGGRAVLLAEFVEAVVTRDEAAGARSLKLARRRGQPFELASTMVRLVKHGVAAPALLSEAYELLGDLGALLLRAQTRNLMQEHGIGVPGRRTTLAENERLLAVLAAEGLSNKEIAVVLGSSERSVAGRLSRLFTRTGYRSRIELSTAMANGVLSL